MKNMFIPRCCRTVLICVHRMGEVACAEEIKAFIAKHNIKQQQIASLAGKCLLHLGQKSLVDFHARYCLASDVISGG